MCPIGGQWGPKDAVLLGPFGSRTNRANLRVLRSLQDHPSSAQEAMWAGDGTQAGHILVMLLEVPGVDEVRRREAAAPGRESAFSLSPPLVISPNNWRDPGLCQRKQNQT